MINRKFVKQYIFKIVAIVEKNLKLKFRFKYDVIISFINPIIAIFMPIIVLGQFFEFRANLGSWTSSNYYVFIFMAYNIILIENIIFEFPNQFISEKYWKTLPALIIAPFNRYNLLLGIFFSHLILISIPFTFFFILCYIVYPVSFTTIIFVILIYSLIALIFSGVGLIIGSFSISNENISRVLTFSITTSFLFSCITYPYEIFPEFIQSLINLNPLYYIFDFIRLAWIEDNIINTATSHIVHLYILILTAFIVPFFSGFIFNLVYKRYGIVGY